MRQDSRRAGTTEAALGSSVAVRTGTPIVSDYRPGPSGL